ncbi:hypothetical protein [Saccharophagus degradans]|uniref:Uncharacterized protein n=1 Tax=Saccharophagus degradans (strain 2-40 / ATCC 43961 / DSM 17024) TaxID=203122 RepID=Q21H02_SACD2|nr:hypothetical protein [Saccharophagus degradans]ABD82027.1 hypothetical protein Sde_2767 [Saccharophagus degradans 2-40]
MKNTALSILMLTTLCTSLAFAEGSTGTGGKSAGNGTGTKGAGNGTGGKVNEGGTGGKTFVVETGTGKVFEINIDLAP